MLAEDGTRQLQQQQQQAEAARLRDENFLLRQRLADALVRVACT
jgi:hypothetical protein